MQNLIAGRDLLSLQQARGQQVHLVTWLVLLALQCILLVPGISLMLALMLSKVRYSVVHASMTHAQAAVPHRQHMHSGVVGLQYTV